MSFNPPATSDDDDMDGRVPESEPPFASSTETTQSLVHHLQHHHGFHENASSSPTERHSPNTKHVAFGEAGPGPPSISPPSVHVSSTLGHTSTIPGHFTTALHALLFMVSSWPKAPSFARTVAQELASADGDFLRRTTCVVFHGPWSFALVDQLLTSLFDATEELRHRLQQQQQQLQQHRSSHGAATADSSISTTSTAIGIAPMDETQPSESASLSGRQIQHTAHLRHGIAAAAADITAPVLSGVTGSSTSHRPAAGPSPQPIPNLPELIVLDGRSAVSLIWSLAVVNGPSIFGACLDETADLSEVISDGLAQLLADHDDVLLVINGVESETVLNAIQFRPLELSQGQRAIVGSATPLVMDGCRNLPAASFASDIPDCRELSAIHLAGEGASLDNIDQESFDALVVALLLAEHLPETSTTTNKYRDEGVRAACTALSQRGLARGSPKSVVYKSNWDADHQNLAVELLAGVRSNPQALGLIMSSKHFLPSMAVVVHGRALSKAPNATAEHSCAVLPVLDRAEEYLRQLLVSHPSQSQFGGFDSSSSSPPSLSPSQLQSALNQYKQVVGALSLVMQNLNMQSQLSSLSSQTSRVSAHFGQDDRLNILARLVKLRLATLSVPRIELGPQLELPPVRERRPDQATYDLARGLESSCTRDHADFLPEIWLLTSRLFRLKHDVSRVSLLRKAVKRIMDTNQIDKLRRNIFSEIPDVRRKRTAFGKTLMPVKASILDSSSSDESGSEYGDKGAQVCTQVSWAGFAPLTLWTCVHLLARLASVLDVAENKQRLSLISTAEKLLVRAFGDDDPKLAPVLDIHGECLVESGDARTGLTKLQKSLALKERVLEGPHWHVVSTLRGLAGAYAALADHKPQLELLDRAWSMMRQLLDEREHGESRDLLAIELSKASALTPLGHGKDAIAAMAQLMPRVERIFGPDHGQMSKALDIYANACAATGDVPRMVEFARRSIEVKTRLVGEDHVTTASSQHTLANALALMGRPEDQRQLLEDKVLPVFQRVFPKDSVQVANVLQDLGNAYGNLNQPERKIELLQSVLLVMEKHYGTKHPQLANVYHNLGNAYGDTGDQTKKVELLEKALELKTKHYGPDHVQTANTLQNLGNAYGALGDANKMQEALTTAYRVIKHNFGPNHHQTATVLHNLAHARGSLKRYDLMEKELKQVLPIFESFYGKDHPMMSHALHGMAMAIFGQMRQGLGGDPKKMCHRAEELLNRALKIRMDKLGATHGRTLNSQKLLEKLDKWKAKSSKKRGVIASGGGFSGGGSTSLPPQKRSRGSVTAEDSTAKIKLQDPIKVEDDSSGDSSGDALIGSRTEESQSDQGSDDESGRAHDRMSDGGEDEDKHEQTKRRPPPANQFR